MSGIIDWLIRAEWRYWGVAVASIMLAVSSQAAVIELVPTRASGTQGIDWMLGPDANTITLYQGAQNVEFHVLINAFAPDQIAGYTVTVDCASLESDGNGRAVLIDTNCTVGQGVFGLDYCLGVDDDAPNFVLQNATEVLPACQNMTLCPNGEPGEFACAAVAIFGSSGPDNGGDYYAATFAVSIAEDVLGTIPFCLSSDPEQTLLRDPFAGAIPAEVVCGEIVVMERDQACCFGDDCVLLQADTCGMQGGLPQGEGTVCDDNQACCYDDGTCTNINPLCCVSQGGSPFSAGSFCLGTVACCLPDGSCTEMDKLCCLALDGISGADGSTCSQEACCFADGSCAEQAPLCCAAEGGTSQGPGSACAAGGMCQPLVGACCHDSIGECAQDVTESQCLSTGGRYGGDDSSCESIDPPCAEAAVPTTSTWGLAVLALSLLVAGKVRLGRQYAKH